MAEGVVSDIASGLISKVGSLLLNEIELWWGVKDELQKLKETVDTIKSVLLDAEKQSSYNHQVKQWLGKLREAMYDADDLLDEFSYEALHQQVMGGSKISKKVRLCFTGSNKFAFGIKMAHKVKALREHLNDMAANRSFHLEERPYVERPFVSRDTHSSPPQFVIGRDRDKEKIIELLCSFDCVENVSVVAIVGIGGLGKTTLAQMVYNDDRANKHFALKMWVCVSNDFDVQLLVTNVLESASGQAYSSTQMDVLKNRLHEHIIGRKYLLVLDDVWNEEINKWSSFEDLLAVGARGSKILITTRSKKVAETSRAISIHEIEGLSKKESWSLFKQMAFNPRQLPDPRCEAIGKEIVQKCGGVPLAIKTIGGFLYSKNPNTEWGMFKDNEVSKIDVFKHDILPILRLSYNNLPSHYKHCFAYCCLYPKGFRISVDELIQLWKAQGCVQPTNQNECLRDAGLEYFKDLFQLSFFQDVEEDRFGNLEYCKIHDFMHGLAISVVGDDFSLSSHSQMTTINDKTRHLSFWSYNMRDASSFPKMKKIRTILKMNLKEHHVFGKSEADAIFCNLRRLRVLDLSCIRSGSLSNSICKLKHLRFLDISYNRDIKKLPNSITDLHNLQVLNLEGCSNLRKWPSHIIKLVNLTDLNNGGCDMLNYIPRGIGKLTKLEKLPEFIIAEDQSISKHIGGLDELYSLNNLRGELEIKNLSFVENAASEFGDACSSSRQNLQKLTLDWCGFNTGRANEEMVLEALCPHPNLKELAVRNYNGVKPPRWLPSITNLVSITVSDCISIQWLPPLDHLPDLRNLRISNLTKLERIDVENGGRSWSFFPSLTHLVLQNCPNLKGFEGLPKFECFSCLSEFCISDCPKLTRLPLSSKHQIWDFNAYVQLSSASKLDVLHYKGESPPRWLRFISSLVSIRFGDCTRIRRLPPFDHLPLLKKLTISSLTKLESIEVENGFFPSLTVLIFEHCPNLKGFVRLAPLSKEELPCFPCLSRLDVKYCPNLICLPLSPELEDLRWEGMKSLIEVLKMPTNSAFTLSQLQHLTISDMEDCTEDELNDEIKWQSLKVLRSVVIKMMQDMVALPEGLQHATTLQSLEIWYCSSLACIPEWMPQLNALQNLTIRGCPKLKERCKNNSTEDWPYISHIPNLTIDGHQIQRDGCYLL